MQWRKTSCRNVENFFLSQKLNFSTTSPPSSGRLRYMTKISEERHQEEVADMTPRQRRFDINEDAWKEQRRISEAILNARTLSTQGSLTDGYSTSSPASLSFAPILDQPSGLMKRSKKKQNSTWTSPTLPLSSSPSSSSHLSSPSSPSSLSLHVQKDPEEAIKGWKEEWDEGWADSDPRWYLDPADPKNLPLLLSDDSPLSIYPSPTSFVDQWASKVFVPSLKSAKPIRMLSPRQIEEVLSQYPSPDLSASFYRSLLNLERERGEERRGEGREEERRDEKRGEENELPIHDLASRVEYISTSLTAQQVYLCVRFFSQAQCKNQFLFTRLFEELPSCLPAYGVNQLLEIIIALHTSTRSGSHNGTLALLAMALEEQLFMSEKEFTKEQALILLKVFSERSPNSELIARLTSKILMSNILNLSEEELVLGVVLSLSMRTPVGDFCAQGIRLLMGLPIAETQDLALGKALKLSPPSLLSIFERLLSCTPNSVASLGLLSKEREKTEQMKEGEIDGSAGEKYEQLLWLRRGEERREPKWFANAWETGVAEKIVSIAGEELKRIIGKRREMVAVGEIGKIGEVGEERGDFVLWEEEEGKGGRRGLQLKKTTEKKALTLSTARILFDVVGEYGRGEERYGETLRTVAQVAHEILMYQSQASKSKKNALSKENLLKLYFSSCKIVLHLSSLTERQDTLLSARSLQQLCLVLLRTLETETGLEGVRTEGEKGEKGEQILTVETVVPFLFSLSHQICAANNLFNSTKIDALPFYRDALRTLSSSLRTLLLYFRDALGIYRLSPEQFAQAIHSIAWVNDAVRELSAGFHSVEKRGEEREERRGEERGGEEMREEMRREIEREEKEITQHSRECATLFKKKLKQKFEADDHHHILLTRSEKAIQKIL